MKKDISLLKPLKPDPQRKLIKMGSEDEILTAIENKEFIIINGPAGIGKTTCKYLLSDNDSDIFFVEIDKNFLKGVKNSEALLKIQRELKTLSKDHKFVVLTLDEEHYCSDMQSTVLIEIVGLLFPSGRPSSLEENIRLVLFFRPKSYRNLWKEEKIPAHWNIYQIWLRGIKLSEDSIREILEIHGFTENNFTKPALELLKKKIASRGWIYPLFANNLLLFLEKNYQDEFTTDDIDQIQLSDVADSVRNLVFGIRPSEQQKIWEVIVKITTTFECNPPLWLIKNTLKLMNIDSSNLKHILNELKDENLIIEEKDEILGSIYIFSHDIYYDIISEKEFDDDFVLELTENIETELNKNLDKIQAIKNPKKLKLYLNTILQRFYFLSSNPFGTPAEYIDEVIAYFSKLDSNAIKPIIHYLELLVFDFYSRNLLDSVSKLYLFIGDYYRQINDLNTATDFYNIGCHILESQGLDSTDYRIKNGELYDKIIPNLDLNDFSSQIKVELASWQWKASKQYEKGLEIRKLLVDVFSNKNEPWAAAEIQWLAEVSELNGDNDGSIQYYNEAIKILEPDKKHTFNVIGYLSQISRILEIDQKLKDKQNIDQRIQELQGNIKSKIAAEGTKIFIISGIGDLFVANQIYYKILEEIPARVEVKEKIPDDDYDIIILFGGPLNPENGYIIYNYMSRDVINEILATEGGYWIKYPTKEKEPIIISIGGYSMFDTRKAAEKFIIEQNFTEIIKYL
jgi:hypothetical protein